MHLILDSSGTDMDFLGEDIVKVATCYWAMEERGGNISHLEYESSVHNHLVRLYKECREDEGNM